MSVSTSKNNNASPSDEDLGAQIASLREDLTKLAATATDDMAEGIENAGRQIERAGRDVRDTATRIVVDHPLTAVGIAAGVGLLLGMLARKG